MNSLECGWVRNITVTKHKSPFLVTWDIFLLSYEDDVTWSRMPANEVMMFVMRLGHWCHSLLRDCWLILKTVSTWRWHGAVQNRVQSAPRRQSSGLATVIACFLCSWKWANIFLTNLPDISVLCIAPWGLCVMSSKGKLSVSQSALGQKPRANDCFVCGNSTWEGMLLWLSIKIFQS